VSPIDPDLAPPGTRSGRPAVLAAIAAGGMLGASARYGIARWLPTHPHGFPWATFWTNLSGSFVLGFLLVVLLEWLPPTRLIRPFAATGILGAYTTMSTYAVETTLLLKDGHATTAVTYALGSLFAGLALAYAGIVLGRLARPRTEPRA
jgi:CrcB protein